MNFLAPVFARSCRFARRVFPFFAFVLGLCGFARAQADDHGDTAATATVIPFETPRAARLNHVGDADYFRFTITAPSRVYISTSGSTDTFGSLRTSADVEIVSNDDSGNNRSNFAINRDLDPGTYYIRVTGPNGATGDYSLYISAIALADADLQIQNFEWDYPGANARAITLCRFTLINRGPAALTNEGLRFNLHLSANNTLSSDDVKLGDVILPVTIAAGDIRTITLDATQRASVARLWPADLRPGSYYMIASIATDDGSPADPSPNVIGTFFAFYWGPDDHGDTNATATTIALNDSVEGRIHSQTDIDVFTFTLTDYARVDIFATDGAGLRGTLLNSAGEVLESAVTGRPQTNFEILRELAPGKYYVQVTGGTFAYRLHVQTSAPSLSDLALTQLTATVSNPANVQFSNLGVTLTNHGPTALAEEEVTFEFFLSKNDIFGDGDDQRFKEGRERVTLVSGASRTFAWEGNAIGSMGTFSLQGPIEGDYRLFCRVKIYDGRPVDPVVGNNHTLAASPLGLGPQRADLAATGVVVTRPDAAARTFSSLTLSLTNNGPLPLNNAAGRVLVYLSPTAGFGDDLSRQIGETEVRVTLASGASTELALSATELAAVVRNWSATVPSDHYHTIVVVQLRDTILVDPVETNNNAITTTRLAHAMPAPDDHGDTPTIATRVALNSSTAGVLDSATDVDYFTFTLTGTTRMVFATTGSTDTVGRLYDSRRRLMTEQNTGGLGTNFLFNYPLEAGTYHVSVTGNRGATGSYTLRVEAAGAVPVDLAITQLAITPAAVTTRSLTGLAFSVRNEGSGTIDNARLKLELFLSGNTTLGDTDDVLLGDVETPLSLVGGTGASTALTAVGLDYLIRQWPATLPGGTYHVFARVSLVDGGVDPTPENNILRFATPLVYTPPGVDDHGNTTFSGTEVTTQSNLSGVLDSASDADVFVFTLLEPQRVVIYTTGDVDTNGTLRGFGDQVLATSEDNGMDRNFRIERNLSEGYYSIRVRSARSTTGRYTLHIGGNAARLGNLSVRTNAGAGTETLIVGFNLAGQGAKPLLLRGVGPSLEAFGVSGALADPTLRLYRDTTEIAANDNWAGHAGITAAASASGAFALTPTSRDAALLETLPAAAYTAQIGGGSGIVLLELYDPEQTGPKLINASARTSVGTGAGVLIAGFTVTGEGTVPVLIRAIGPTLGTFGVSGALADPRLEVIGSNGRSIAVNDNWGGTRELTDVFTRTGAFSLAATSRDAAVLLYLAVGSYTARIEGVGATTGVALVEIYEVR